MSIDTLNLEDVLMGDDLDIEGIDNSDESMDQISDDQNFVDTDNSDELSDQSFDYQDIVDNDNSDESGFALLRDGETATRYPCSLRSCNNWSPSILKVSGPVKYYCQCHYPPETPPGKDRKRFRCIVQKRDRERCSLQDYRVLHSEGGDFFRCNNHRRFYEGRLFRHQCSNTNDTHVYELRLPKSPEEASEDIVLTIPSGQHEGTKFGYTGEMFDGLTSDYGPKTKDGIRKIINSHFRGLSLTKAQDISRSREEYKRELKDEEYRAIDEKYRDLLASGHVYFAFPKRASIKAYEDLDHDSVESGVIIKIGYTSKTGVDQRTQGYPQKCGMASSPMRRSNTLVFAHLLEKIIHEIYKFHQVDIACKCGKTHTEYFRFDQWAQQGYESAFNANLANIMPHVYKWEGAIRTLENVYKMYEEIHSV